jgi:hypothetical protein
VKFQANLEVLVKYLSVHWNKESPIKLNADSLYLKTRTLYSGSLLVAGEIKKLKLHALKS